MDCPNPTPLGPFVPVGGEGVRLDAEVVCFDAAPSPLIRVLVYDANTGLVTALYYTDMDGNPALPAGNATACGETGFPLPLPVEVTGPVGPGDCADAVRVTQCAPWLIDDSTPIEVNVQQPVVVVPLSTQQVSKYRDRLVGAGTWTQGVNTHGGKMKAVSVRRRSGGGVATVTITDGFGTVTTLLAGESESWSVTALDDELIGPFVVTTTAAANDVIIVWTEAP